MFPQTSSTSVEWSFYCCCSTPALHHLHLLLYKDNKKFRMIINELTLFLLFQDFHHLEISSWKVKPFSITRRFNFVLICFWNSEKDGSHVRETIQVSSPITFTTGKTCFWKFFRFLSFFNTTLSVYQKERLKTTFSGLNLFS